LEPWNSSREKALELKLEAWGEPGEVTLMATPVRYATNRREATDILKEIADSSPFTSRSGLKAKLSTRGIGKIVSSAAVNASFSPEAHYLAAVNIDKLFSNAIEPWEFEMNPSKENDWLKSRRYLYAPMIFQGKFVIVKMTVKEYMKEDLPNKLYSVEAIDWA
jgi:hypothetical protein